MKAEYNEQGKFLWFLVKMAGWDRPAVQDKLKIKNEELKEKQAGSLPAQGRLTRFEAYLLKTFKVTHINALSQDEMRKAINVMKRYADKAQFEQCKPLRQSIMAIVIGKGKDKDWLHEQMVAWKFGDSLRELGFKELVSVRGLVMTALGVYSTTKYTKSTKRVLSTEGTEKTEGNHG